jgi:protein SCO1/2
LGKQVGRDMFLYLIAHTPDDDSPAALKSRATWSRRGPGWKFLTGKPADVESLRHSPGLGSDDPVEDGNWRDCQSQSDARCSPTRS